MKRLLLLLFLLVASAGLHAQGYKAPEVVISNEKANIAGKVYYVHKVLPKQTVFSICKAYGIKSEDLNAANPDIKNGLKAGSIIFIPVDAAKIPETADTATRKKEEPRVVVPEPEPEPAEARENVVQVVERVIEHRVRWFDTLSGIARKYGVSEQTILDYNGLKESDSIRGKVLLIPVMGEAEEEAIEPDLPDTPTLTEPEVETPEAPMPPVRRARWFTAGEPMHIALILPFNLKGTASSSFLNFYSGALMAVREQKEKGAHLVLNVYDLGQGADAILSDPKFQQSDLVVGPVEAATMAPFLAFSDQNGIPLVSPLDHKVDSLVEFHPFLFQVPASPEIQVENLIRSLHARSDETIILVTGTSSTENRLADRMEALLQADGISYRKAGTGDLSGLLSGGTRRTPAKILIGSESKSFTTDAIRHLNTLAKRNIPLEVWCTNRVRNYETSDPDAFFNVSAHTSAPYFVDYSDPRDQDFIRQYRALFYADPDDFAFQGHDVFTYFISSLMKQGTGFFDNAEEYPMQLLHCNFHFVREDVKSGWRNCATRNLLFEKENYSITLTK
ncbi:MAG: LysM peptidoglycan-binding domain-containing protein [Bacteroidales bacterium]|nr:LysM peptidoglycan-binding domain-containing protein [Bacteroidales bacterium]